MTQSQGTRGGVSKTMQPGPRAMTRSPTILPGYGGAGVYNDGHWTSTGDTISGNSATDIYDGGGVDNDGTWTSTSDAVSGNSAPGGGGVINESRGTWKSTDDAISGNSETSTEDGGGWRRKRWRLDIEQQYHFQEHGRPATAAASMATQTIGRRPATRFPTILQPTMAAASSIQYTSTWTSTNDTISGNSTTGDNGGGVLRRWRLDIDQ